MSIVRGQLLFSVKYTGFQDFRVSRDLKDFKDIKCSVLGRLSGHSGRVSWISASSSRVYGFQTRLTSDLGILGQIPQFLL